MKFLMKHEKNNRKLCYSYVDEGFTYATKSSSIILGVKALRDMNNKLYGYGVILIPDSELITSIDMVKTNTTALA